MHPSDGPPPGCGAEHSPAHLPLARGGHELSTVAGDSSHSCVEGTSVGIADQHVRPHTLSADADPSSLLTRLCDGDEPRSANAILSGGPESDARFRALVEAVADALLVVSSQGAIVYANPAAGTLFGRPHTELVGEHFGVPLVTGETTEVDVRRADGVERVVEMRTVASTWYGEPAHLASLRDVTDRKKAEEAARAATATLHSFYDTASIMMGVAELMDDDILIVSANAATARFYRTSSDKIVGRTASELGSPREVINLWVRAYHEAERTGNSTRFEYERAVPNGSMWLSATMGLMGRTRNGRPQFSFVVEDATDRKRALGSLAEAARRKDEFLAMLAHELRNPLAPIRNALYILETRITADDRWRDTLAMMSRQVQHMGRLLDDLLDVSRVTHGTIRLQQEFLDASDVLAWAIETARPSIDARRHCLKVDVEPGPHPLHGDLARLVQIISNLLINAAKYTPAGGEIVLSLHREENTLIIRVRDNGDGIQPELLSQLFEPFSQGVRTLARSEGGLGLGLSLVRSLTELHGGTVHGASEGPGRGAEFEVRLPVACGGTSVARTTEKTVARGSQTPLRILVVDDNHDAADSLVLLLQLHGHTAEAAYDGLSAVEIAQRNCPDVIFLDIGLPGMDGYAVARALRAAPETVATRIVALSGYAREEDRKRSRAAGFDDHLAKPLDPKLLVQCLNSFAAARPSTQEVLAT